jgi:NAD(P)-dependent dehydrogenase (short-subunit alcohol dehydrogenase family)
MVQDNHPYAIITGASRGIGAAIAKLLALDGYDIVVNYESNDSAARSTADEIIRSGARALVIRADIAREQEVLRMFDQADRELGRLAVLVNNGAITGGIARVADIAAEPISRMLAINVTGSILCSREAVRRMSTRNGGSGGAIVNISSLAARTGGAGEWVPYAASKGAINTFTVGLAREVAAEGIRVNAVAPGLIETDLHRNNGSPDRVARMAPSIPMERGGEPEEVAEAVRWLVSPAASYVTGTILDVGGGR